MIDNSGLLSDAEIKSPPPSRKRRSSVPRLRAGPIADAGFRWQTLVVIAILSIWEGLPFQSLGMAPSFGFQLYTVIILAGCLLYVGRAVLRNRVSITGWEVIPVIVVGWCTIVSFNWSVLQNSGPMAGWLAGFPTVAPLLTVFLLSAIGATRNDAERGLYYAAVLGSSLAILDSVTNLGFLSVYARGSAFTDGHIVFFKTITAFGVVIAAVRIIYARGPVPLLSNLIGLLLTGYNALVLTESRLISVAILLALPIIWLLAIRGGRKIITAALAPLAIGPIVVYFVSTYLGNFKSLEQYLQQDRSAQFRNLEYQHFQSVFDRSQGMGFGYMSDSNRFDNVVTFAQQWAGHLVGSGKYGMSIVDIGLSSALFQFGYVGLILVLLMTVTCVFALLWSSRGGKEYAGACAVGALMGTLMLNPISTNFFTLSYTAHVGGLLWFIASRIGRERAADRRAQASMRAPQQ